MKRSITWLLAGVLTSAMIAGLGWWTMVTPAHEALAAADEGVRRSADDVDRDRHRLEELAALARRSSELERQAAQLAAEAPTWSMDRLVTAVESAVIKDGATLVAVSPGDVRDLTDNLTAHPMTMSITGDYDQLRAALAKLQNLEPRITISSLSITGRAPGESLTMVMSATAYSASPVPGTSAPKPDAPPTPDRQRDPFAPVIPPKPTPRPRPVTLKTVVVIDSVTPRAITLLVSGRMYRAPVGGSVGDGVRFIRSVSKRCADLRYGTRTTRACEGESVMLTRRVWPEGRPASRPAEPRTLS